ncbi:DUF3592 domain-containing protein [Roseibium sp. Sym1]|uniref:DUF3592 domain-containing protein n=1 Tax=Roseibium sp. Sym1 TaxID=3016006 RepID=UPI0022B2CF88|nr:DUF3592 domain-containing protein [Roseibium sp. Sym1]
MFVYLPTSGNWLLRTRNGKREASWRMWLLIFLLPAGFLCATGYLVFQSLYLDAAATRTTGEVVRIYERQDWTPWDGDTMTYSPVFRYQFSDGSMTEASTGLSSPNWNFPVGSTHEILFFPARKGDVKLDNFETLWAAPLIIAIIALLALIPSAVAALFLLRWLKGGRGEATAGA